MRQTAIREKTYRADIDGLRAVAVLSVIIFHFNKLWLPGGFVGVDIFFVISGYLITGILAKKITSGSFSFVEFYGSRMRRIFPAAFVCVLVVLLVGLIFMLPSDYSSLAQSAAASVASVANIYFWLNLDTSYFASSSELVPLLHMWSLGVEEQFYLLWPIVLFFVFPRVRLLLFILIVFALILLSFWVGEKYLISDQSFSYYMLPSRAGELLIGGLASLAVINIPPIKSRLVLEVISSLGFILVGWSIFSIGEEGGFPGFLAAIPVVGVALIIFSGAYGKTVASTVLSFRPFVWVGLVSYSLYLWHWPVLSFYRYAYGEPAGYAAIGCAIIILCLSLLSYFCVERVFRRPLDKNKTSTVVKYSGLSIALVVLCYFSPVLWSSAPFSGTAEYQREVDRLSSVGMPANNYVYNCQMAKNDPSVLLDRRCLAGTLEHQPTILLMGDSNAAHFVGFFKSLVESMGLTMRNATHSSCVPIFTSSGKYTDPTVRDSCEKYNAMMREEVGNYDTVIIGANWLGYAGPAYQADIEKTVAEISSRASNVIIALRAPYLPSYDPSCNVKAIKIPGMDCASRSTIPSKPDYAINTFLSGLASKYSNVTAFAVQDYLCKGDTCSAYFGGVPVYYDPGHLSMVGSALIGSKALEEGLVPDEIVNALKGGRAAAAQQHASTIEVTR